MEEIICNLCGEGDEQELYRSPRYRAVICRNCSLAYLNPRLTREEYTKYYTEEYQKNRHNVATYNGAVIRLKQKGSYEKKKVFFPFIGEYLTSKSRVLEIGSGWGTLLKVIKDTYGSDVYGAEISSQAVEISRRLYGINTENKTLEVFCAENNAKRFDFIIMYHVLEHILDPLSALASIRPMLGEKGALYLGVPNLSAPYGDLSEFFRIEHCYYFTLETLGKILNKSGFKLIKVKKTPTDLQVIAVPDNDFRRNSVEIHTRHYSLSHLLRVIWFCRLRDHVKNILRPLKWKLEKWFL